MPLYEYRCLACERVTEALQRFDEPPWTICPHCGGELRKLASAPAFHLKGSGWYSSDYGGKPKQKESGGESAGGESKPAAAGESSSASAGDAAKTESKPASSPPPAAPSGAKKD